MNSFDANAQPHSPAWVFQTWIAFSSAILTTTLGILFLPVDYWTKGFMGMGLLFTVGSTLSLAKTLRDVHESQKIASRLDEVKLQKILVEHDPYTK